MADPIQTAPTDALTDRLRAPLNTLLALLGDSPLGASRVSVNAGDLATLLARIEAAEKVDQERLDDWEAEAALNTSRACGYYIPPDAGRSDDGKSASHAYWMLAEIAKQSVTGRKAHRWLGYAQGLLVAAGVLSLEQAKQANKEASDAAAQWQAGLNVPAPPVSDTGERG